MAGKSATIAGVPIRIISQDEAETLDFVVCGDAGTPTPWHDNVHTTCALCGAAIIHRPHAPKRPAKICMGCALARAEAGKPH